MTKYDTKINWNIQCGMKIKNKINQENDRKRKKENYIYIYIYINS
jgi:hypothetical protein